MFLPAITPITIPNQTTFPAIAILPAPPLNGPNNVCAFTDVNGNTAVEVFESDAETINIGAFFVDEGLMRSVHVTFPITAPTAAVTGPVAASTTPGTTHDHEHAGPGEHRCGHPDDRRQPHGRHDRQGPVPDHPCQADRQGAEDQAGRARR